MVASILIVDSSSTSRKLVANKFKHIRPEIVIDTHATIGSALPKLREHSYDLVALGSTLPDGSGLDLATKIRNLSSNAKTPIIMLSGNTSLDDTHIRAAHGIDAHFDKSLGINALIEYLESFLPKPKQPPPHILFIEDSKTVIAAMKKFFVQNKFSYTAISSGDEAKTLMDDLKSQLISKFDIIITDLNLDGNISGLDLIRHVRENLKISKINLPILLATGNDVSELNFAKLRELGVNDFVTKPIVHEILLARMEPWVLIKQNMY